MSGDLSGFSMFDLFKSEAESHAAALNRDLIAIEGNPSDLSHVEPLMRAAHSIKGAARIVGLDMIVELAHAMEDCFVAVQKGMETLTTERVDQLLAGVDVMEELSKLTESELDSWIASRKEECQQLTESLRRPAPESKSPKDTTQSPEQTPVTAPVATDDSVATDASTETDVETEPDASAEPEAGLEPTTESRDAAVADLTQTSGETPAPTKPMAGPASLPKTHSEPTTEQRTIPVNAVNLDRIMRLASESMVESRQLQSMQQSLVTLQKLQRGHAELLERLVGPATAADGSTSVMDQLRELTSQSDAMLQFHASQLERAQWRSERTSTALYHQVIGSRMRPFVEGTLAFPRMIRDLAKSLGKQVSLEILGGSVAVDRDILRKLEAPLNHILRNCVDHGLETPEERQSAGKPQTGRVRLEARHHAGMLTIEVRDDGRGIDAESLRGKIVERKLVDQSMAKELNHAEIFEFLFLPGFSTASQVTEVSGRGVGLDVVRSMVQEVSGTVRVESKLGQGAVFTLRLPVTLSVVRAVLAEIAGELYAFPLAKLQRIERVPLDAIRPVQGRQQFTLDDVSVGLVRGTEILELKDTDSTEDTLSVVVIGQDEYLCGITVDRFIGEQDLVVRPLDRRLGRIPHISAAALTEQGDPLLIVDVEDLLYSIRQLLGEGRLRGMNSLATQDRKSRPRVLVVEDSITVREVERQLLAGQGYDVDVAVDGQDGWHAMQAGSYDLLVSDVDMPRMNGIELIRAVRADSRYEQLPVIIVSYKDREEDRLEGFEAGANAYLTKGSFHDDSFIRTVADLIGEID